MTLILIMFWWSAFFLFLMIPILILWLRSAYFSFLIILILIFFYDRHSYPFVLILIGKEGRKGLKGKKGKKRHGLRHEARCCGRPFSVSSAFEPAKRPLKRPHWGHFCFRQISLFRLQKTKWNPLEVNVFSEVLDVSANTALLSPQ